MTFVVTLIWPGIYLVVASTGDVVGIFGSAEAVNQACDEYRASKLH